MAKGNQDSDDGGKSKKGFTLPELPFLKKKGAASATEEGSDGSEAAAAPKLRLPAVDIPFVTTFMLIVGVSLGSSALAIRLTMPRQIVVTRPDSGAMEAGRQHNPSGFPDITTGPGVTTSFSDTMERPIVPGSTYVHPQASLIGYIEVGRQGLIAPQASIRADIGKSIVLGDRVCVLDGAIIQALPTQEGGKALIENTVMVNGETYAVHIGDRAVIAPQAQVHGPAVIGPDSFIGMQALVFRSRVGERCVIEPRAAVIGVNVPDGHVVPAGMTVTDQEQANRLPVLAAGHPYADTARLTVKSSIELARGYRALYPLPGVTSDEDALPPLEEEQVAGGGHGGHGNASGHANGEHAEASHEAGHETGHEAGHETTPGHDEKEGAAPVEAGHETGHEAGHEAGHETGHAGGHEESHDAGGHGGGH